MDTSTVIGTIAGTIVIAFGIFFAGIGIIPYLSISSVFITIGGSFAAVMISNPMARVRSLPRFFRIVYTTRDLQISQTIVSLVSLADRARKEGILALEDSIEGLQLTFMKQGIQLVVDGTDPEIIRTIMYADMQKMNDRHAQVHKLFDDWGKYAPAFGLIGTVIGLIAMLGSIGGDIAVIGRGLQTALVTTLYGAIMANFILIPIRSKLEDQDQEESLLHELVVEGVLALQSGDNPRILLEKLLAYLPDVTRAEVRTVIDREFSYGN